MKTVKTFHAVLANSLTASLTNTFVWFAVTFWVYLQTKSVLAMSFMAGIYLATVAVSGFFLGSRVDRYPKKYSMLGSSIGSLVLYGLACLIYVLFSVTGIIGLIVTMLAMRSYSYRKLSKSYQELKSEASL